MGGFMCMRRNKERTREGSWVGEEAPGVVLSLCVPWRSLPRKVAANAATPHNRRGIRRGGPTSRRDRRRPALR